MLCPMVDHFDSSRLASVSPMNLNKYSATENNQNFAKSLFCRMQKNVSVSLKV